MDAVAHRKFFEHLPDHERERYAEVLRLCERQRLGVRCEMVGGKDFHITIGFGLASARWWLDQYGLP